MAALRTTAILLAAIVVASSAFAHATLRQAIPAADAVLERSPNVLTLEFNEAVDMASVEVGIADASGKQASLGEPEAQPRFGTRVLRQINQPLSAGVHTVTWRALSNDGDWASGSYRFTVQSKTAPR